MGCFNGRSPRKENEGSGCKLYEPSSAPSLITSRVPTAPRVVKKRNQNWSARLTKHNVAASYRQARRVFAFFRHCLGRKDELGIGEEGIWASL